VIRKLFGKLNSVSSLQLFQLARFGALVLLGIIFAKSDVSKSDIGTFENLIFLSGLVSFFWVNSLIQLLLSEFVHLGATEKKKTLFRYYYLFQLLSTIAALLIVLFYKNENAVLIALYVFFNSPALLNEYILYLSDHKKWLLIYAAFLLLLIVAGCGGVVLLHVNFHDVLVAFVAAAFFRWVTTIFLLSKYSIQDFKLSKTNWQTLLILTVGFILSGSSEYITGWFVKENFSLAAFTEFRYGTRDMPLFTILASTFSNAMIPVLSKDLPTGIQQLKKGSLRFMHLFFPIAIVLTLFAPLIFKVVFSPAFFFSGKLFVLTMLLTIPRVVFPQTIFHAKNAQKWLTVALTCEIITLCSVSWLLIPFLGIKSIIYAIILSFSVEKAILAAILKWKYHTPLSDYLNLQWFFLYSLLLILSTFVSSSLY